MARKNTVPWDEIDTVLLDMDGTLFDYHYEAFFWDEMLPRAYARKKGITTKEAFEILDREYKRIEGSFDWADISYWEKKLGMRLWGMRQQIKHLIKLHPHTVRFLRFLRRRKKRVYLVSASHSEDIGLKISTAGIGKFFDGIYSQFDMRKAKTDSLFWKRLRKALEYDEGRTLFVDDTFDVLEAARASGIKFLVLKSKYNSRRPPRKTDGFLCAHHLDSIMP